MAYATGDAGQWRPLPSQFLPGPPTALAFDPASPLLFAGFENGTVASYFASPTSGVTGRYTSYRAHNGPVSELSADNTGVLSVGGDARPATYATKGGSVKLATKRGLAQWTVE